VSVWSGAPVFGLVGLAWPGTRRTGHGGDSLGLTRLYIPSSRVVRCDCAPTDRPGRPTMAFSPQRLKTQKGKDALVQELKTLHDTVSQYDADTARPAWMDQTCPVLVSKHILSHQHKDVRLLACCCVVEMLRVYAPEAPFSNEQLKDAFEAIIIELRGLQHPDRAAFERVLSILESLAVVKSCVIVVSLAEEGNDELVASLFQVLLQSARAEHAARTRSLMADVMKTCVEEFEGPVPDSLMEIILEAVLHYRGGSGDDDDEQRGDATQLAAGACVQAWLLRGHRCRCACCVLVWRPRWVGFCVRASVRE
jgi:hypothetical protein